MRAAGASNASPELPDCFRAFDAEFDFVHRVLRRYGANATDADDLAQEVFLVLWRRWRDYDPARPLRPWLAGIVFRVAQEHFRRRRREVPSGILEIEEHASPLDHLAAARARSLVLRALAALPERQRAILILHDLEGISIHELTAMLLVPASTLYSRLKKAHETFARSVRRLQRQSPASAAERLHDVEALLAIERTPRPEPPERRRRALARARAFTALPALPPPSRRSRPWPLLLAAIGAAAALVFVSRRPTQHPAAAPVRTLAVPPADGLVGYWRFDDGPGSPVARDRSGHGTDCVLHGMDPRQDWTEGRLGGGVAFGGLGWLACAQPRFGGRSNDLTVALWVKRTASQPGYHALVTRQVGDGALDHFFVGFRRDLIFLGSHVWGGKLGYPAPPLGRWFHLAMVHAAGQVTLFVDGAPVIRQPAEQAPPVVSANPLTVGGGINGPDQEAVTQRFAGVMDELLVYDRALPDGEVRALASPH